MITSIDFKISTEDFYLIASVRRQIEEIYEKQKIFGLSLETLELTRRFNKTYSQLSELNRDDWFEFDKFMNLTRHLERNLLLELNK